MKTIWVISLFPEYFRPLLEWGVVGQALQGKRGLNLQLKLVNLREFSHFKYKNVDDTPYGGGPGMIMRADILEKAFIEGVVRPGGYAEDNWKESLQIIVPRPQGRTWTYQVAKEVQQKYFPHKENEKSGKDLVFVCGRYEGIDERFIEHFQCECFSLGDFILSGGELATLCMIDSLIRLIPGTLGQERSLSFESFTSDLLEYAQYTRPLDFHGLKVPETLVSGHHQKIEEWKKQNSCEQTMKWKEKNKNF